MAKKQHIDDILRSWAHRPEDISVRVVRGSDKRDVLQMRIDLGLLQLEIQGRPDGERPEGFETYFDYLQSQAVREGETFTMSEQQCQEADREFVQFYHRRVCWLTLRQYEQAIDDADHTLAFMDFCSAHSPDEQWTLSHEQYRPFVLFHRIQAAALAKQEAGKPDAAVQEINAGLDQLRRLFAKYEAEEQFDDDELVNRLIQLREWLREHYRVGRTLQEQLAEAIAAEKYELAAQIRDQISAQRGSKKPL